MIDYSHHEENLDFSSDDGCGISGDIVDGNTLCAFATYMPCLFVLLVERVVSRGGVKWKMLASLLAAIFTVALLLISPETAVAHALRAFACFY